VFLFVAQPGSVAVAQTLSTDALVQHLMQAYQGKTFVLRNFYADDQLRFDQNGQIAGPAKEGIWSVDGAVEVAQIKASTGTLQITGQRLALARNGRSLEYAKTKRRVTIELALDAMHATAESLAAALSHVFLTQNDHLLDLVPDYWKACIRTALTVPAIHDKKSCHFTEELMAVPGVGPAMAQDSNTPDSAIDDKASSEVAIKLPKAGVSPPEATHSPDPKYSSVARKSHIHGVVTLACVIDQSGHAIDIKLTGPLGYGLDESAVEAVQGWIFKPGMKNGVPVKVAITIEMDFRL
jgi:TonB family protein